MKRWQLHLEVLDSEDEDWRQSNDSYSQTDSHRRKKRRTHNHVSGNQSTDSNAPLQALATGPRYNSEDDSCRNQSGHLRPQLSAEDITNDHDHKEHIQPFFTPAKSRLEEAVDPEVKNLTIATKSISPASSLPLSYATSTPQRLLIQRFPSQDQLVFDTILVHGQDVESGSEAASDDLPDIRDIFARGPVRGLEQPDAHTPSEASSSPLSERDVTPELPIGLEHLHAILSSPTGKWLTTTAPRRNLRKRNEVQLHPYLMDKAKYQQLCKTRGIRPVRFLDENQPAAGSQDASESDITSSQLTSQIRASSPGVQNDETSVRPLTPSQEPRNGVEGDRSANYDMDSLPELADGPSHGKTRLKPIRHGRVLQVRIPNVRRLRHDSLTPLSPQSSSSASQGFKSPRSRVQMPGYLSKTPVSLPTPQISSDARSDKPQYVSDEPESDVPPKSSRPIIAHRQSLNRIAFSSGDPSLSSDSGHDSDVGIDPRGLVRERRRIKGVLPASWLKLDFQKQQSHIAQPARRGVLNDSPRPSTSRHSRKGVAQVVYKRRGSTGANPHLIMSDEESGTTSESSLHSPRSSCLRQSTLGFKARDSSRVWQSVPLDDEDMEMDCIDPMLPSRSRIRKPRIHKRKRQPEIRGALHRAQSHLTLSNSSAPRPALYRGDQDQIEMHHMNSRTPRRSTLPRLGILDAPTSAVPSAVSAPQFIRLAKRAAFRSSSLGRHSPHGKIIRLATGEDSADARGLLQAWREGGISPKDLAHSGRNKHRSPLPEGNAKLTQQTLPLPILSNSAGIANGKRTLPKRQRPQSQQLHLSLDGLPEHPAIESGRPSECVPRDRDMLRPLRIDVRPIKQRSDQLETLEEHFHRRHRAAALESRMLELARSVTEKRSLLPSPNFRTKAYENDPAPSTATPLACDLDSPKQQDTNPRLQKRLHPLALRKRKRLTSRLEIDSSKYRQPSTPKVANAIEIDADKLVYSPSKGDFLQGLGPFGIQYATDFGIQPLQLGTYFHSSSFIGSGELSDSIMLEKRNLDISAGRLTVHMNGTAFTWGAWTEEVSAIVARIPQEIQKIFITARRPGSDALLDEHRVFAEKNIDYLLRSLIRYCSRSLSFFDPLDRESCSQRLSSVAAALRDLVQGVENSISDMDRLSLRVLAYALVLTRQSMLIADHSLVSGSTRKLSQNNLSAIIAQIGRLVSVLIDDISIFYQDNLNPSQKEAGIRDSCAVLTSVVILQHVLANAEPKMELFWDALSDAHFGNISAASCVGAFDRAWRHLLTVQPLQEIDVTGVARVGSRFTQPFGPCYAVRKALLQLFDLYPASSMIPGSTINDYMRATLARCHVLIGRWGTWQCEPILTAVFDFFARRGLALLDKEESRGSPPFMFQLHNEPNLEVKQEDRSFTIFLKMSIQAIRAMRKHKVHDDRKIGSLVWRLIPNHGRTYPKDAEVREADLDALRNHHDLICSLYFAAPPSCRPRVSLLSSLVEHTTSHREACRISVRAWSNLASYQVSTTEPLVSLEPFGQWYENILTTTIGQYRLARIEAEHHFALAKAQLLDGANEDILERTVAINQRQIAATLADCLVALKNALKASMSLGAANHLMRASKFWLVLDLFDPNQQRLQHVILTALDVVTTGIGLKRKFQEDGKSQISSEDSQDYGDFGDIPELLPAEIEAARAALPPNEESHRATWRLLSNAFGADTVADDVLLTGIVETWVTLASSLVRSAGASWQIYLDEYSTTSWMQLRDTVQRHYYTPLFMTRVVEMASDQLETLKPMLLTSWLVSLVDREAVLKFQHTLTSSLLNNMTSELLHNLPFARMANGRFEISLSEMRQRRTALISSILCNMRQSLAAAALQSIIVAQSLRKTYADILRRLMGAMRSNYQALQTSTNAEVASAEVDGAYVGFVQNIVSYLQQYTSEICPVDRFFTDSAAFPLPVGDPTYVVGRLRSYAPKLGERRARKQLGVFVQTVSERASADGEQHYLALQLIDAIAGDAEYGDQNGRGLRDLLLTTILPPYLEAALSNDCAWIMADPIFKACAVIVSNVHTHVNWSSSSSVEASMLTVRCLLQSCQHPVDVALEHAGLLDAPHVLRVLSRVLRLAEACLSFVEYTMRTGFDADALVQLVKRSHMHSIACSSRLRWPDGCSTEWENISVEPVRGEFPDTEEYVQDQLRVSLDNKWYASQGQAFLRFGNQSREIPVDLHDAEQERRALQLSAASFDTAYHAIFDRREQGYYEDGNNIDPII